MRSDVQLQSLPQGLRMIQRPRGLLTDGRWQLQARAQAYAGSAV